MCLISASLLSLLLLDGEVDAAVGHDGLHLFELSVGHSSHVQVLVHTRDGQDGSHIFFGSGPGSLQFFRSDALDGNHTENVLETAGCKVLLDLFLGPATIQDLVDGFSDLSKLFSLSSDCLLDLLEIFAVEESVDLGYVTRFKHRLLFRCQQFHFNCILDNLSGVLNVGFMLFRRSSIIIRGEVEASDSVFKLLFLEFKVVSPRRLLPRWLLLA